MHYKRESTPLRRQQETNACRGQCLSGIVSLHGVRHAKKERRTPTFGRRMTNLVKQAGLSKRKVGKVSVYGGVGLAVELAAEG